MGSGSATEARVSGEERKAGLSVLAAVGSVLLASHLALFGLAGQLGYGDDLKVAPIPALVAVEVAAGAALLCLLPRLGALSPTKAALVLVVALGGALRLLHFAAPPMLEHDFYRYLWDGAIAANGHNPYALAPAEAATDPRFARLIAASGLIFPRIAYAELTTVYPPVAQLAFALAHWVAPFSLTGWRALLLLADAATLGLLVLLLRRLGRSPLWIALYWWNPLVTRELANGAHMDGLLPPFLLAAMWFAVTGRRGWSASMLALAAGVKLWPVLLLPLVLRPLLGDPRRLAQAAAPVLLLLAAMAAPMLATGIGTRSGLLAYASGWAMNDGLFQTAAFLFAQLPMPPALADAVARLALGFAATGVALAVAWRPPASAEALCRRVLVVAATVFLLSPAQFPWYFLWLAPLLPLAPSAALLLPTALLPLYELRFRLAARGEAALFDHALVWLEWLPVWSALIYEGLRRRSHGARAGLIHARA